MPAATPLPSIVWPSRSIVMPSAPMTRPSQRQSARSFLTLMLVLITWPQKMKPGTGSEPTYHVNFAGDGSSLPVMSVALTWNSRAPVGMPVYVLGDVHGSQSPFGPSQPPVGPSFSLQSKVAVASSLENVNVACVRTVIGSGPESMVVSGGVTSTSGCAIVHVRTAGVGSTLPLRSIAATSNVCVPGRRPEYVRGVMQFSSKPTGSPSSRHWNLRFGPGVKLSLPVNSKVAAVLLTLSPIGPAAMKVSGGSVSSPASSSWTVMSISHSQRAGVRSRFSTLSAARTSRWCGPCSSIGMWNGDEHSIQTPKSGGVSMSGGSFGCGGSVSGSGGITGSGGASSRHSNVIAVGGVVSSVPVNVKVADDWPVTASGPVRISVLGATVSSGVSGGAAGL